MRILTLDRSDVHRGPLILVNAKHPVRSISPVPLIPTEHRADAVLRSGGALRDVAPTLLDLLGIAKPAEMSGRSLLAG